MSKPIVIIEHFDIEKELQCRCGCKIFNYSTEFLIRLQAFRYILNMPLIVTGGGRCHEHNIKEGGAKTSLHICEGRQAMAIDVSNDNCKKIYEMACASRLFNEVIWYKNKNFVHLALDKKQKCNFFEIKS